MWYHYLIEDKFIETIEEYLLQKWNVPVHRFYINNLYVFTHLYTILHQSDTKFIADIFFIETAKMKEISSFSYNISFSFYLPGVWFKIKQEDISVKCQQPAFPVMWEGSQYGEIQAINGKKLLLPNYHKVTSHGLPQILRVFLKPQIEIENPTSD